MRTFPHRRAVGAFLAVATVLPLAACGEDSPDVSGETALPTASEDQLIDAVDTAPQVDTDPTPQAGTGGEIPGYDPVDKGEGVAIEDDAAPEPVAPENRARPGLENAPAAAPDPLPDAGPAAPAPEPLPPQPQ
jgi:hypothetical protein